MNEAISQANKDIEFLSLQSMNSPELAAELLAEVRESLRIAEKGRSLCPAA